MTARAITFPEYQPEHVTLLRLSYDSMIDNSWSGFVSSCTTRARSAIVEMIRASLRFFFKL